MLGKSFKHIPEMAVKNGDESNGIEFIKNHQKKQTQEYEFWVKKSPTGCFQK